MSSSIYSANFDDEVFKKYVPLENNRGIYDDCAEQRRNLDNNKKLKFVTTNHADLLNAQEEKNFFGIAVRDQLFVPSDKINSYSELLNGKEGNKLTNPNIKTDLGQLPLTTMPYKGQVAHGNVDIENAVRPVLNINKYSCIPKVSDYYKKSFQIFEGTGAETPNPINSVEYSEKGFAKGRGGINTRLINP